MPTPDRFIPEEPLSQKSVNALPTALQLSGFPVNYRALLIRLLTGTLNIKCQISNKLVKQRNNYSKMVFVTNKKVSAKILDLAIPSVTLEDLGNYLFINQARHMVFYKELFHEYCNYFDQSNANQGAKAFLHLYRIIEFSAYSFPVAWASKSNDYLGTFKKLREYFSDPKRGELVAFKMFVREFVDPTLLNSQLTLNLSSLHPDWQSRYFHSIEFAIREAKFEAIGSTPDNQFVIKAENMLDLAITLRNKYFHFLAGDGRNFNSENIPDANEFFIAINEPLTNWLAIILFQLIEYEIL